MTEQRRRALIAGLVALAGILVPVSTSGRIFAGGSHVAVTVSTTAAAGLVAWIASNQRLVLRLAAGAMGTIAAVAGSTVAAGGAFPRSIIDTLSNGLSDIVSARWPTPVTPAGVGLVALVGAVAAAVAVDAAAHRRPLTAIACSLATVATISVFSAPAGPPEAWTFGLLVLLWFGVLAATQQQQRSRVGTVMGLGIVLVATAVPIVVMTSDTDRYDPRERAATPAAQTSGVSPLARVDEWQSRQPAESMFTSTSARASRWRLVGLTRYDGRSWSPAADYRRSSGRLSATGSDPAGIEARIGVEITGLDAQWIPMLQETIEVDTEVMVDGTASGLLLDVPPVPGDRFGLTVVAPDVDPDQARVATATSRPTPFTAGFDPCPDVVELASTATAGAATDASRAEALARFLREGYVLDSEAPPGHSIAVLELMLNQTKTGRAEQYVAAFAVLGACIGLPVRVAVGFDATPAADGTGSIAMSDGARAWPEVEFQGIGWTTFDPVPSASNTTSLDSGGEQAQSVNDVRPSPPTTAPPTDEPTDTVPPSDEPPTSLETRSVGSTTVRVAIWTSAVLALIGLYVVGTLGIKRRRRSRRRTAERPEERTVGALLSAMDLVVDLGGTVRSGATDRELAAAGARLVGAGSSSLDLLAERATSSIYGPMPTAADADSAWAAEQEFERTAPLAVGRWRFARSRLSWRSIRRGVR